MTSSPHLEPGLPIAFRIRENLQRLETTVSQNEMSQLAKQLIQSKWPEFLQRHSYDFSKTISSVRCRINILQTMRGIGLVIRLLSSFQASIRDCNLHPSFAKLVESKHGLIILSGPTGSGKSTTLAALVEEINSQRNAHIITIESPIEYQFKNRNSLIRQREVGSHTPSFEQGIIDSLREDPDVLIIGEIRTQEAMRLALSAAETGHLVITSMHSATCSEAIARMIMSFPAEQQSSVQAQLADTLVAVISQRLSFAEQYNLRVPLCEILLSNHATKTRIRKGELSQLISQMQTGAADGMWTKERYQKWIDKNNNWSLPKNNPSVVDEELSKENITETSNTVFTNNTHDQKKSYSEKPDKTFSKAKIISSTPKTITKKNNDGRIEIPDVGISFDELVNQIDDE